MFMAAWLNLFLLIGLSRISEISIALIALLAGLLNLKDFWRFGWGMSLSIPNAAKPAIYETYSRDSSSKKYDRRTYRRGGVSGASADC